MKKLSNICSGSLILAVITLKKILTTLPHCDKLFENSKAEVDPAFIWVLNWGKMMFNAKNVPFSLIIMEQQIFQITVTT